MNIVTLLHSTNLKALHQKPARIFRRRCATTHAHFWLLSTTRQRFVVACVFFSTFLSSSIPISFFDFLSFLRLFQNHGGKHTSACLNRPLERSCCESQRLCLNDTSCDACNRSADVRKASKARRHDASIPYPMHESSRQVIILLARKNPLPQIDGGNRYP